MNRLVQILFAVAMLTVTVLAQQASWQIDQVHSSAQFAVRHLGLSTVRGAFTKVLGSAQYDAHDLSKSSVEVTIVAESVDTRVQMRDDDLRSSTFLDVQKYPTIVFRSTEFKASGNNQLKIAGQLTIHGITKEVVLDVDGPSAPVKDAWGKLRIGALATTKIDRRDFGISGAPAIVGDDINIILDVELIQSNKQ